MSKAEFLKALREKLLQEMDSREVENNVRYYSDYIDDAVRNGKNTQEVLDELGDPLLIARTIIDTYGSGNVINNNGYEEANYGYQNATEADEVKDSFGQFRKVGGPGCIIFALVFVAILILLVWVFGTIVSALLPIIIPIILVVFFFKLFRRK